MVSHKQPLKQLMETNFRCPYCDSTGMYIDPTTMGWRVTCHRSHEIFPDPRHIYFFRKIEDED